MTDESVQCMMDDIEEEVREAKIDLIKASIKNCLYDLDDSKIRQERIKNEIEKYKKQLKEL